MKKLTDCPTQLAFVDAGGEAASEGLKVSPTTAREAAANAFRIPDLLSPQRPTIVHCGTRLCQGDGDLGPGVWRRLVA
jgi:hypothetical protein